MCVIFCELLCQDPAKVKEALISSQVDLLRMKLSRIVSDKGRIGVNCSMNGPLLAVMNDKGDMGRRTEGEEMMVELLKLNFW